MTKKVTAVPKGYRTATPCLTVNGIEPAIDFYQRAFGAKVLTRSSDPTDTVVVHATIKIGNSIISLNQEIPEISVLSPASLGNNGSQIHLYVANVDELWANAMEAGAVEITPLADAYWGDRMGTLIDPFGHRWSLATRVEHVSGDELHKRAASLYQPLKDVQETQGLAA
jgi:PhnB protein